MCQDVVEIAGDPGAFLLHDQLDLGLLEIGLDEDLGLEELAPVLVERQSDADGGTACGKRMAVSPSDTYGFHTATAIVKAIRTSIHVPGHVFNPRGPHPSRFRHAPQGEKDDGRRGGAPLPCNFQCLFHVSHPIHGPGCVDADSALLRPISTRKPADSSLEPTRDVSERRRKCRQK
ncbi:hypothetical protein [Arthrobacter sp. MMS18-M83]|uniref:hypothetical protein n=1 Tax=Arthrobacter sp. MMS18-M83 TaxID=2996261 RepID=UPI00227B0145|nr:hypothetical protein [Arthrobacter sp. MMS18-M83]WAH99715.1 hypothetical protein OW521_12955 [Arthrobacter sp. MMS18-M83]